MQNQNKENSAVNNLEIEKKVLAILINSPDIRNEALNKLKVFDFINLKHELLFQTIERLVNSKQDKFDLDILCNDLKNKKQLSEVGGLVYLSEIMQMYTSDDFLNEYIEILIENSKRLQIAAQINNWQKFVINKSNNSENLWQQLHKGLNNLEKFIFREQKALMPIHHIVGEELKQWRKFPFDNQEIVCSTGFTGLDEKTKGFQKGDLIILAARPSMGKTAFALKIAMTNALGLRGDDDGDIIIFSLEMSENQLAKRLITSFVPNFNFTESKAKDFKNVEAFKDKLKESNIFIDSSMVIDVFGIQLKLRTWSQKRKIKLVIIDYLQLLQTVLKQRSENRNLEVSIWTQKLKEIARDLKIPVLCLSQLSRSVEKREDKRPLLSDLRDSGSIEQDADLVLFLYRENYYRRKNYNNENKNEPSVDLNLPHKAEVIIAKHRNGPTGIIELVFAPNKATFYETDG